MTKFEPKHEDIQRYAERASSASARCCCRLVARSISCILPACSERLDRVVRHDGSQSSQSFTTGAAPGHVLIIGGGIGDLSRARFAKGPHQLRGL
jgi:hypothetical protein